MMKHKQIFYKKNIQNIPNLLFNRAFYKPNLKLVLCGCMAQQDNVVDAILKKSNQVFTFYYS